MTKDQLPPGGVEIEIAVPAGEDTFGPIRRALAGYDRQVAGGGRRWPPDSAAFDLLHHQTWVREPGAGAGRVWIEEL